MDPVDVELIVAIWPSENWMGKYGASFLASFSWGDGIPVAMESTNRKEQKRTSMTLGGRGRDGVFLD